MTPLPLTIKEDVIDALILAGRAGLTSRELAYVTGHDQVSVSPGLRPLQRAGVLTTRAKRRPSAEGATHTATVWVHARWR